MIRQIKHKMPPPLTTTTPTQWINDYRVLPKSFTLQERLNCDALQAAVKSPYIHQPDIPRYKALINKLSKSDIVPITYTRGEYGRYWPDSFCSTQMWRLVRWEAVPKEVTDLDAVSCFPNIVLHLCKLHSISPKEYSHIQQYTADRTPYISALNINDDMLAICNAHLGDAMSKADLGKRFFNMFCFGAGKRAFEEMGCKTVHFLPVG